MRNEYISVPKSLLSDKSLSLKAKGLYVLIMALPLNWNCSIEYLAEEAVEGKSAIRAAIHELESQGYLERRMMNASGRFYGMEYVLKVRAEDDPL